MAVAVLCLVVVVFLLFVVVYQRRQKNMIIEKRQLKIEFENQLLQTQIEIQEQTFSNISQELHDNIGQSITLAKLNLNTLPNIGPQQSITLNNTKNILNNVLSSIRHLAKSMLGEKIAEIGIEEAMRNELNYIAGAGECKISVVSSGEFYLLSPQQEIVGFRILQEGLHNIIKHAEAKNIILSILYAPNSVTLQLKDDGKGFDEKLLLASQTGVGLKNMQNRSKLIQADFSIYSAPNQGTLITIKIPNHYKNLN
jgi:signal transduction histidine kinase